MTYKKQWYFGLSENGNIRAESGRYGLVEIKPLEIIQPIISEEPVIIPIQPKKTLWQRFVAFLKRLFTIS